MVVQPPRIGAGPTRDSGPAVRTRSRRLSPDRRRDEILDAALDLFGRRGEHAVSIEDVAAAAGTSRNSVYRCFGSKNDLLVAAMELLGSKLMRAQEEPATGTPSEQLAIRLKRYFDVIERYSVAYSALIHMDAPGTPEGTREVIRTLRRKGCQRVYDGLGIADPSPAMDTAVNAWVAAKESMAEKWLRERHMPRAEVEKLLTVMLGLMLLGAAIRDGDSGDVLLHLVESETADGPFAEHLMRAGDLMSVKLFARLTGMMHAGSA